MYTYIHLYAQEFYDTWVPVTRYCRLGGLPPKSQTGASNADSGYLDPLGYAVPRGGGIDSQSVIQHRSGGGVVRICSRHSLK